ncbi:translesion error-prone DNA polymerase V autoproteolytic subunit [Bradyrhizobium diazoefficiens]|nr:S24 family peptidase [Bradyrhizobium diazoefficiens]QQO22706.1 translesion error-prone DNA polymerase V autoproteolytic subunit [Bradyrhizobium diazoefficiens]
MRILSRGQFHRGSSDDRRHQGPTAITGAPLSNVGLIRAIEPPIDSHTRARRTVPLVGSTVTAGLPSPADEHLDRALDFNELLVQNPAATFAVRVAGDSMIGAGIFTDDIAIVDRSRSPVDCCIVLALVDGDFTLKRYRRRAGKIWLQAENPSYKDLQITDSVAFEVWGVVSKSIRML